MLEFEWDDEKAERNLRKHGVSFEDAAATFRDLNAFDLSEETYSDGEVRRLSLGMHRLQLLAVVYVERAERIRIISARKATKYEQKIYAKYRAE